MSVPVRAVGRGCPVWVAVVAPVGQADGSVVELGEGWVEDGAFDAVAINLEFCEEGLVESAAVYSSGLGVELLAVFEQAESDLEPLFDELGVGLDECEQLFGFMLLGIECCLAALEVSLGDGTVEEGVDQLLALGCNSLDTPCLSADQLLIVSSLFIHLAFDISAGLDDELGRDTHLPPVAEDSLFDDVHWLVGQITGRALLVSAEAVEVGVDLPALSA